jgi:multiple sugar transport system ATP-binding protein
MADVTMRGVHKSFGKVHVIKGVDLDIDDKEFVVFVGPSGCGKSTLLRLIAGLEDITAGEVKIDGQLVNDLPPAKRGISMVFQSYALYPHMTVYENMAFALQLAKTRKVTIDERVNKAARILQIEHLLKRKPAELSGGQRQRVAIGRAIVREPKVFLFDEPLSNLDAALRVQMRIEIANLHRDLEATMIYVTHDQVEAMTLADKIVVLNAGVVEQVGSPQELYHHPRNRFVAGFIGSPTMNFIETRVTEADERSVTVDFPAGNAVSVPARPAQIKVGDPVTLGIRPEHMREGREGDIVIAGEVSVVERLGSGTYLYIDLDTAHRITMLVDGDTPAKIGDSVTLGIPSAACHLFDTRGNSLIRLAPHPRVDAPMPH